MLFFPLVKYFYSWSREKSQWLSWLIPVNVVIELVHNFCSSAIHVETSVAVYFCKTFPLSWNSAAVLVNIAVKS